LPHYSDSRHDAFVFILISLCTLIPFAVFHFSVEWSWYLFVGLVGLSIQSLFLSVSAFFLFVDVRICCVLLNSASRNPHQLQLSELCHIRNSCVARVDSATNTNNIMMFTALWNLLLVLVLFFVSRDFYRYPASVLLGAMGREFSYAFMCFWEVAKVNELSDGLTAKLGKFIDEEEGDEEEESLEASVRKLKLFANAQSQPISFPIAGMRLTRKDVLFRLGLWLIWWSVSYIESIYCCFFVNPYTRSIFDNLHIETEITIRPFLMMEK
jgi:hypothetical protein